LREEGVPTDKTTHPTSSRHVTWWSRDHVTCNDASVRPGFTSCSLRSLSHQFLWRSAVDRIRNNVSTIFWHLKT